MKRILLFLLVAVTSIHCKKDDEQSQTEIDNEIILNYIADNNLDAMNIGSGLYYVDEETGTGDNPDPSSTVRVVYKGYFTDGQVFDLSELK